MSDRDRLLVAAAAIGLTFCALIWSAVGIAILTKQSPRAAESRPAIEQSAQTESDDDSRYRRWADATPRGILESEQTPTGDACESDPECRQKEDLRAQQSVALASNAILFWTRFQTIIAVLGTALLWWGLFLNQQATNAATEQTKIARREFRYSERPILRLEITGDNMEEALDAEGAFSPTPWVQFTVTNIGKGTAIFHESVLELSLWDHPPPPGQHRSYKEYYFQDLGVVSEGQIAGPFQHTALGDWRVQQHDPRFYRTPTPHFFGRLLYRDQRGHEWEFGFAAEYMHFAQADGSIRARFVLFDRPPFYYEREREEQSERNQSTRLEGVDGT
jgi:hypothetical protein